ncbi:MAG: tetratricopeptide repeat protein, partial [Planctomycetota bacterium]
VLTLQELILPKLPEPDFSSTPKITGATPSEVENHFKEKPSEKSSKSGRFSRFIPFFLALILFAGMIGYEKISVVLKKQLVSESNKKGNETSPEKTFLLRAQADFASGNFSSAWNFIGQTLKINPQNLEAIELRAKYYFLKKAYSLAIPDATTVLTKNPKASKELLQIRGLSYYSKNQFSEAIADLLLLEGPEISLKLAKCYAALGELEKASNYYMDYLKSNQEDLEVRRENLQILEKLGYTDSVITEFQKLGQTVPSSLLFKQANKFYQEEKYQESLETLDSLLLQNPKHLTALELQSKIYFKQERWEPYIDLMSKVLPLQPSALNYKLRGLAYLKLKQFSSAISDFSASIGLETQDPQIYYYRALALENLPDQERRAIQDYGQALRWNPQFSEALLRQATLLEKQENWTAAIQNYSQLLQIQPDGKYYFARGNLYRRLRDSENTLADYQQAIQLAPENLRYYHQRASFYFSLNRYGEAIQDWKYILDQDPSQTSNLEKLIHKAEEKRREESK